MANLSAVSSVTASNYISQTAPAAAENVVPDTGFSEVLTQAIEGSATQSARMAAGGLYSLQGVIPESPVQPRSDGFDEALSTAASSRRADDAQVALFMLMMLMMQSGSESSDFSMQMQMMAAVIAQMQESNAALRGNAMSSDFHPYILHNIDRHVFNSASQVTGTGQATLPVDAWRPTTPAITSDVGNRSAALYRAVVDQFQVETAERYRPFRNGNTFCNIFVWDVTRAMGAEIPHYTDPATGDPMFYPNIRGARQMGAIATCQWLRTHGQRFGWREVDAETAQMHANRGGPAITSAGGLGHVQMVVPSTSGGFDPVRGVTIAQAGRINSNYMFISGIYSANTLANSVRYWIHD